MSDKKYIELGKIIDAIMSIPVPADCYCTKIMCVSAVQNVQSADVAPIVRGHWIINSDGYYPLCSNCMREPESGKMTKFCSNCGAKMYESEESGNE